LTGSDVDDRGWGWEKPLVLCEVAHAKRGRHYDQSEWLRIIATCIRMSIMI
jgi:hypothetical protein